MRILKLIAAALALVAGAALAQTATTTPEPPAGTPAQTITLTKWQDIAPLVDRQSKWINKLRADNDALRAEVATLRTDMGLVVGRYDILLRYLVIHACINNAKIASITPVFSWVKPFPLGSLECPPEGTRFYIPSYLGQGGPPVPPAQ